MEGVLRIICAAALAAILFVPTIVFADQDQPAAAPPAATQPPASTETTGRDEIICKTEPPPTGTRLGGGRECHTQQEWDSRMHETQKALEKLQNGPLCKANGCPG